MQSASPVQSSPIPFADLKRILIIGTGHLGRLVATFAARLIEIEIRVASRRPGADVFLDLTSTATFSALDSFDAVVDCADASTSDPCDAAEYCLRRGISFVETSADSVVLRSLLLRKQRVPGVGGGRLILGVDIFPGLSSLLVAGARH